MRQIKQNEFHLLSPGDLIGIGGSLQLVTHVSEHGHTFYSAPIIKMESDFHRHNPLARSSHWAGSLEDDEFMIVFDDAKEAFSYMEKECADLIGFYFNEKGVDK